MVNQARSVVAEHLDILSGLSGALTVTCTRSQVFQELATRLLCQHHNKHDSQAIAQWRHEFSTRRISIIAKLGVYYNYGTEDSIAEGSGGDAHEIDQSVYHSDIGKRECEQGQHNEEAKDAIQGIALQKEEKILPSQLSTPVRARRRYSMIPEDEVAKDVTLLLEQPAMGNKSEYNGWIYVISLPDLPGTFKVGFTKGDPEERFDQHRKCYPNLEVVIKDLIPHAYRVEQLMLREFSNYHCELEIGCQGPNCKGTQHRELLEVDKTTLLESLRKWITFVESYPYNGSGKLKPKAREKLPPPALRSYLRSKPDPRRRSLGSSSKKNEGDQDFPSTPTRTLNLKPSESTSESPGVGEEEFDPDKLCSRMEEGLEVTPSKPKRKVK